MATKMVDRNPHTGESLRNKTNNDNYRNQHEVIFGAKPVEQTPKTCAMQGIRVCCGRQDCVHRIKND
jgi:hypothetical protein